jgi:26S proteasome regulatory subunit N2
LVSIVERMFASCFQEGLYRHTLGIALESRRLDLVERSILESGDVKDMLRYCFAISQSTAAIASREFRGELLAVLVKLYKGLANPDYLAMAQCFLFLQQPLAVAELLEKLVQKDADAQDGVLIAYQIALDLGENQNQPFLLKVSQALPGGAGAAASPVAASADPAAAAPASSISTSSIAAPKAGDDSVEARLTNLRRILSGELPVDLYLHFLYEANKSDLNILRGIKDKLEQRNSITHGGTVVAHAIMHWSDEKRKQTTHHSSFDFEGAE